MRNFDGTEFDPMEMEWSLIPYGGVLNGEIGEYEHRTGWTIYPLYCDIHQMLDASGRGKCPNNYLQTPEEAHKLALAIVVEHNAALQMRQTQAKIRSDMDNLKQEAE